MKTEGFKKNKERTTRTRERERERERVVRKIRFNKEKIHYWERHIKRATERYQSKKSG